MIADRLLVVADAHLGAAPAEDEAALRAFLSDIPQPGDAVLFAGDLFDFWFTYRRVIPRQSVRVTAAIIALAERIPILMVGGNHDRWGDTFWPDDVGITFDASMLRFAIGRRDVLAIHGDGLHEERWSAAVLNRILRSRTALAAFRRLHPDTGYRIAHALGHDPAFARAHPEVVEAAVARQRRWAEARLGAAGAPDALVMAHTHRATAETLSNERWYINPGAWLEGRSYAVLDDTGARIEHFS